MHTQVFKPHSNTLFNTFQCPGCLANKTFIISAICNQYYCKQCQRRGLIEIMREGLSCQESKSAHLGSSLTKLWGQFASNLKELPDDEWQRQALAFVMDCQQKLMGTPSALSFLYNRGFTLGTMQDFCLGWNPISRWVQCNSWNVRLVASDTSKKLWLPSGLVIPTYDATFSQLLKVRILNFDDAKESFVEIAGSLDVMGTYKALLHKPIVILESELDAMILEQCSGDICTPVALSGCNTPDKSCHKLLKSAPFILYGADINEVGFKNWSRNYPETIIWPMPKTKTAEDTFKMAVTLRKWVLNGIRCVN